MRQENGRQKLARHQRGGTGNRNMTNRESWAFQAKQGQF